MIWIKIWGKSRKEKDILGDLAHFPYSDLWVKCKKRGTWHHFQITIFLIENARSAGPNHIYANLAYIPFVLSHEQELLACTTGNKDNYSRASLSWQDYNSLSPTWKACWGAVIPQKKHQSSTVPLPWSILARPLWGLILHKRDDIPETEQGILEAWRYIMLKYVKLLGFYHWMDSEAKQRFSINFLLQSNISALGHRQVITCKICASPQKRSLLFRKHSCQKCAVPDGLQHT